LRPLVWLINALKRHCASDFLSAALSRVRYKRREDTVRSPDCGRAVARQQQLSSAPKRPPSGGRRTEPRDHSARVALHLLRDCPHWGTALDEHVARALRATGFFLFRPPGPGRVSVFFAAGVGARSKKVQIAHDGRLMRSLVLHVGKDRISDVLIRANDKSARDGKATTGAGWIRSVPAQRRL